MKYWLVCFSYEQSYLKEGQKSNQKLMAVQLLFKIDVLTKEIKHSIQATVF